MMKPTTPSARLKTLLKRPMTVFTAPAKRLRMVEKMPLMISTTEANRLPTPFAMSDMVMDEWWLGIETAIEEAPRGKLQWILFLCALARMQEGRELWYTEQGLSTINTMPLHCRLPEQSASLEMDWAVVSLNPS